MGQKLKVVMAQTNLLVGDMQGNVDKVLHFAARARDEFKADVVIFPELTLTGYPPEDLLYHGGVRQQVESGLRRIQQQVRGIDLVLGYPKYIGEDIFNICALIRDGEIVAEYQKQLLPNYGVFDEKRYFKAGDSACVVDVKGLRVGLTICEDLWECGKAAQARAADAQLLFNISASPYQTGRQQHREEAVLSERVDEAGLPIVYVNLVGGQDELVFDGSSLVVDQTGKAVVHAPSFVEGLYPVEFLIEKDKVVPQSGEIAPEKSIEENIYNAIVMGVKDYVAKNGFKGVVIGLSGGVDSALTLAIAVDAVGADKVTTVMMPSPYTSELSLTEAKRQAESLGVEYHVIPINKPVDAFTEVLGGIFSDLQRDATEENIQARCRGVLLMAISNKFGRLVLTTGNKSETAVGYATLYGDMAGGFAPIKDVSKTMVYALANYRNSISPVIPEKIIQREPSAELAPGQKDSDSLPPYEVLDAILEAYVEDDKTYKEIVASGFAPDLVKRVTGMVKRNEYKRRQAPPGVRISRRAFGRDRRYPITSGYDPEKN